MSSNECQNGSLDQQFAIFLNPIRDLAQNWEIDISKILQEYLEKIDGTEKNFQNRSSVLNFAEAALVIQGSVNIYCKKIDYFEKIILQVLSDLGSSQGNSSMKVANSSDMKGGVKKKKSLSSNDLEFTNLDYIQIGKHIDMVNDDDNYFKKKNFKFLPVVSIQLEKGENSGSHEIELFEKGEFISAKTDFYLNRCCLRPEGSLSIDPHTNSFQDTLLQVSKTNGHVMPGEPNLVFQDCNESFNDPVREPDDLETCNEEIEPATIEQNTHKPIAQNDECDVHPGTSKDLNNNISEEKDLTITVKLPNGKRSSLRKRSSMCPKQQPQQWHESDPHGYPLRNRPVTSGMIRRLIPCPCHTIQQRKRSNPRLYIRDKVLRNSGVEPMDVYITRELHKFGNKRNLKVPPEIIEEANAERLKRENILKTRKPTLILGEIEDQNINEQLRTGIEEENIEDDYHQLLIDDDPQPHLADTSFPDVENTVLELAVPPDPFQIQNNETNLVLEPITSEEWDLIGDHLYEPCTLFEASLQRTMAHHMLGAQQDLSSNKMLQKVKKWQSRIVSKLEVEEKRKHFDIHAYGDEIINKFSKIGETLSFEEVTRNFPQKDVSRVFLSCLMLGNSYNIKLCNSGENLSMDDLNLTLLSRIQQHQHMEEYAAPSQQQTSPKRKRTESIVMHHRGNKKKKVTFDSGIFSGTLGSTFSFANF